MGGQFDPGGSSLFATGNGWAHFSALKRITQPREERGWLLTLKRTTSPPRVEHHIKFSQR